MRLIYKVLIIMIVVSNTIGICMEKDSLLLISSTFSAGHQKRISSNETIKIYSNGKISFEKSYSSYDWNTKNDKYEYGQISANITFEEITHLNKVILNIIKIKIINKEGINPPDYSSGSSLVIYKNGKEYDNSVNMTGKFDDKLNPIYNELNILMTKYKLNENIKLKETKIHERSPKKH